MFNFFFNPKKQIFFTFQQPLSIGFDFSDEKHCLLFFIN